VAKKLLRHAPGVGAAYGVLDGLPVRRVRLPKTGTHVYYSIDEARRLVTVLAIWGTTREGEPEL